MGKFASPLKTLAVLLLGLSLFASFFVQPVQAQGGADCTYELNGIPLTGSASAASTKKIPLIQESGQNVINVRITSSSGFQDYTPDFRLHFLRTNESISIGDWPSIILNRSADGTTLTAQWTNPQPGGNYPYIDHKFLVKDSKGTYVCTEKYGSLETPYNLTLKPWYTAEREFCNAMSITPAEGIIVGGSMQVNLTMPDMLLSGKDPKDYPTFYRLVLYRDGTQLKVQNIATTKNQTLTFGPGDTGGLPIGNYTFRIIDDAIIADKVMGPIRSGEAACSKSFCVGTSTEPGVVGGRCEIDSGAPLPTQMQSYKICNQIADSTLKENCLKCLNPSEEEAADGSIERPITGMWTGIGCLPTNAESLIQSLIRAGLAISGGIALLMFLGAGFLLSTSQGDKKRADEAKELMTSSVFGLLFIIFSVTILQFIGIKVLQIPGFGDTPEPPPMAAP